MRLLPQSKAQFSLAWCLTHFVLLSFPAYAAAEHTHPHHYRHGPHDNQHGPISPRSPFPLPPPLRPPAPEQKGANDTLPDSNLTCTPFGECEPCPPESLHEPFCRPFGNRRLMHCVNTTTSSLPPPSNHNPPDEKEGSKIPAWESCGRIPRQERADFFEFVVCNVAFVIISLAVVIWRSRVVQARQARVLAARIGVGGGRGRRA